MSKLFCLSIILAPTPAIPSLWSEWKSLSHVRLFVTQWTTQSMESSRPEYWSGYPFPSPGDPANPGIKSRPSTLQADSLPAEPQGKPRNTGVHSPSLLQQIFLIQELNWGLLHRRQIPYQLSYQGSPSESESHPVMSDSLRPHGIYSPWNSPTHISYVSCIGRRVLYHWATWESYPLLEHS